MKIVSMFLAAMFMTACMYAQDYEDTVFGNDDPDDEISTLFGNSGSVGGYLAFTVNYNELDNKDGMMIGGRLGGVFGHNIAFGVGGYGFFNESAYNSVLGDDYNLAGGYGGFYIEPIIGAKYPVHISVPIMFGAGGVGYTRDFYQDDDDWDNDVWDDNVEDSDAFFLFEPGVEVELNMVRYIRLCFGAYYRYTSDVKLRSDITNEKLVPNDVLNGLSFGLTLKLGKF